MVCRLFDDEASFTKVTAQFFTFSEDDEDALPLSSWSMAKEEKTRDCEEDERI